MRFGLTKKIIRRVKDIFAKYGQVEEVILYGSRAKGNYRNGSDIDLVVKGKDLNLSVLYKISHEIDDLLLPYTFDLSIYQHIDNDDLLDHIRRVGKIFYKREDELCIQRKIN